MNLWKNLQNINKNLKTKKQAPTQTAYIDGEDTQSSRPDENQVRVAGINNMRSSINYAVELQTNPSLESFRVLEAEMAKFTQLVGTPTHTKMPTIANFGNVIVSQDSSDCQMQGNNESSLVGIVNSDTLTQDEMDELAQNALLANLDKKHNADKLQLIVGASNPHTSRPAELNASNETLLGANAHLSTDDETISQDSNDCQVQGNLDSSDSYNESMQSTHKRRK